ncbi:MAG: DUF2914 domain-containing protein [bacterium]
MSRILILLTALLLLPVGASAQDATESPSARLGAFVVCQDVVDREPVGEAESYPSTVGTLYCFTKVLTDNPPVRVFHRWFVGDKLVDEIPVNARGVEWRCWSRKTILPSWNGACRVEVLTEAGDVLGTKEFTLTAAGE